MTPQKPLSVDYASPGMIPPKRRRGLIGWILFVGLAIMFVMLMGRSSRNVSSVSLSQLSFDLDAGAVNLVTVSDSDITYDKFKPTALAAPTGPGTSSPAGTYRVSLPTGMGSQWDFIHWLISPHNGSVTVVDVSNSENIIINLLVPLIPWLLIFGFIWFFVFRQLRANRDVVKQPTRVVIMNPEALQ